MISESATVTQLHPGWCDSPTCSTTLS
uniref:Uncharacterized protein n=1 Tax=Arundo donax TaxID=35708 RepID=A0A0A9I3M2_ARUDO